MNPEAQEQQVKDERKEEREEDQGKKRNVQVSPRSKGMFKKRKHMSRSASRKRSPED
jgi:hypothetical protein